MKLFSAIITFLLSISSLIVALPTSINLHDSSEISPELFESLEELARIVDISYCVGSTGIQKPFKCVSRCHEFEGFELIEQWNTGILMSDSCGYIALSHPPFPKRIILAFRGTYSIANTVVDLSTIPAEYMPFPSDDDESACITTSREANAQRPLSDPSSPSSHIAGAEGDEPCTNCTVHAGFLTAWKNTRCTVLPLVEAAVAQYPDYQVTLVGHSLGGAVAALASLEFMARGWKPQVTTFGEPRVGNQALVDYIDRRFTMVDQEASERTYRRVTHANDPVPLLPLEEWGYKMHSGEVFISKVDLSPARYDIRHCAGDEDGQCIAGTDKNAQAPSKRSEQSINIDINEMVAAISSQGETDFASLGWRVPDRYRLWELFFAHRDYFWRLGLCVPGGDPKDWWRTPYPPGDGDEDAVLEPSTPKMDLK